jgi:hypothetical protein
MKAGPAPLTRSRARGAALGTSGIDVPTLASAFLVRADDLAHLHELAPLPIAGRTSPPDRKWVAELRELYEAATLDGAGNWRRFRSITVPLISPTILLTSIITVVGSFQVFAQIAVLTQGGPGTSTTVLVYYLYQQAFQFHRFGYGATLSVLLFVIVLTLTVVQWQMRKKWVFHES